MSIKKLLILSAAGLAAVTSAAAFAGGPDQMEPSYFAPAIYVDAHGGYSFYDWPNYVDNLTTIWFNSGGLSDNKDGGGIGGADVGFQFFKNIAVEVGGYYLPEIKGLVNENTSNNSTGCGDNGVCASGKQYNWMVYAATKFSVPIPYVDGLDIFAKVGAVWRAMSNENQTLAGRAGMKDYWNVIFGAGMRYEIMQSGFNVGVQWLHIPSNTEGDQNPNTNTTTAAGRTQSEKIASRQPAQNLLTGSVGYQFDF